MATKKLGLSVTDTKKKQNDTPQPQKTAEAGGGLASPAPYQGQYRGEYGAQIQQTMDSILNREPFSYNVNADKLYQQYKDNYTALGKTAMQDTVGNAALLTGGYGNSYGVTAGAQAYNGYMQQLNNIVPELEQRAYERWLSEGDALYSRLSALQNADNTAYGRYRDSVSDYYNNRDYNRSVYESDRSYNYKREQDALAQSNWQKEFDRGNYENDRDYNRSVYENDRNYNRNVYESDRKYLNDRLAQGIEDEKNNVSGNAKFSPSAAYAFLDKYTDVIYSETELVESMYQMFGEQEGFYEWLVSVEVPGGGGDTALDVLYSLHPELADKEYSGQALERKAKNMLSDSVDLVNAAKFQIYKDGTRNKAETRLRE
ncbi:MAG: hypothetical protein J1E39_03145 [Eubacterium sp.]|nr:hypothetical protein [Eubacterium sp.]